MPIDENHYDDDGVRIKTPTINPPSPVLNPHLRVRATRDLRMPESSLHSSAGAEFDDTSATVKKRRAKVPEDGFAVLRDPKPKVIVKGSAMPKKVTVIGSTTVGANNTNLMPPSSAAAGTKSTSERPKTTANTTNSKTTTNEAITTPSVTQSVPEENSNASVAVSPSPHSPVAGKKHSDSYKVESTQQPSTSARQEPMAPTQTASSRKQTSTKQSIRRPSTGTPVPNGGDSQRGNKSQSLWTAVSSRTPLSVRTAMENTMTLAPTATCIDWDETKALTFNVNLASRRSPSIFCLQLRWVLLIWGLVLSFLDSAMLITCVFYQTMFLRYTFNYVFILTFPSGPALLYLMITQKFSGFFWKTHISCQVFRLFINSFLFADYYFTYMDEKDLLESWYVSVVSTSNGTEANWVQHFTNDQKVQILDTLSMYYASATTALGVSTILTVVTFGFATTVYYYEKDTVVKKQDRWRRRLGEVLEAQGLSREAAMVLSTDVVSTGHNCQMNIVHPTEGNATNQ
uniref:XK-related protein n=1 Tax=Panagrellus redivivus TaxID=6233 RepID=A0A7E4VCL3_PANRE